MTDTRSPVSPTPMTEAAAAEAGVPRPAPQPAPQPAPPRRRRLP